MFFTKKETAVPLKTIGAQKKLLLYLTHPQTPASGRGLGPPRRRVFLKYNLLRCFLQKLGCYHTNYETNETNGTNGGG